MAQQALLITFTAKPAVDIRVDPNTEKLSITNYGIIPISDINVYPTVYVSDVDFELSPNTKVFFLPSVLSTTTLLKGVTIERNLDNGTSFIFYETNNNLSSSSSRALANQFYPVFFKPYDASAIASMNRLYYFFRVTFKNGLTNEQYVRYILITGQKGPDWFNEVPKTGLGSGGGQSGSNAIVQKQLDLKKEIYEQQKTHWNDVGYYTAY
jgi:hypothetical protein